MTKSATRVAADKVTFTQAEVTSAVALKAPIASPSFTGNMEVYGASTPKLTVKSGNGTSASIKLQRVNENDASTDFEIKNNGGTFEIRGDNTSQNEFPLIKSTTTQHQFFTNDLERMRIDNTGNVYVSEGLKVGQRVIRSQAVPVTTAWTDALIVGKRMTVKITFAASDASGGTVYGYREQYVSVSNDTATQGSEQSNGFGAMFGLNWKTGSGTSTNSRTLQIASSASYANQGVLTVEIYSQYADVADGTGNGQVDFLI